MRPAAPLTSVMLHEPTATEIWSTGGERMGVRDGAAAVVVEPTRWHAAASARTPLSGSAGLAGFASEVEALAHLRGKLSAAIAAIDARLAPWPSVGGIVERVNPGAYFGEQGTIVRRQDSPRLPWVVRWPDGCETGYAAHDLRPAGEPPR